MERPPEEAEDFEDFTAIEGPAPGGPSTDPRQQEARRRLIDYITEHPRRVFFSRQLEILLENDFYHWITNRAIHELVGEGFLRGEGRRLQTGSPIHLVWHHRYRYYRRQAARLMGLVNEYASPNVGAAIGLHGEFMVLEGLARRQFVMLGREVKEFRGVKWTSTNHNLDFVFERDNVPYGVEVKNTLRYMAYGELQTKVRLCQHIGVRPMFVVRMMPRGWIREVVREGGFVLVLKWQLYPWTHADIARRVKSELGLPVDAPRRLYDRTVDRFVDWHEESL